MRPRISNRPYRHSCNPFVIRLEDVYSANSRSRCQAADPRSKFGFGTRSRRASMVSSPLATRTISVVGFAHAPDAIIDLWVQTLIRHGVRSFWIYDCLYDLAAMRRLVDVIHDAGGIAVPSVMYGLTDLHDDAFFARMAGEMATWPGVQSIYLEDAAGVLRPERAATLLPAVVRWARFPVDNGEAEEYELAERAISGAAMAALDGLATQHGISDEVRDRLRREGYERLELANARAMARERAMIDAEVGAMEVLLDSPDPLADGSVDLSDQAAAAGLSSDRVTLQMVATSTEVDLEQRSPLIRHEEMSRLKLAVIEHKREVLRGLRRSGTVDDLVVHRISADLDLEQVRLQGIEQLD